MIQESHGDVPAHLVAVGMTNRPERIDDALKRPGRMGDEVFEIPDLDIDGAEQVCLVYCRASNIPWLVDGNSRSGLDPTEIAEQFLRPALAQVFPAVVLRYSTETQRKIDITAGQIMASVHFRKAISVAKNRAAERHLFGVGVPAVGYDDIVEGLLETALSVAAQMEADPQMLVRHLKIKTPVVRVDVTPREELEDHRFQTSTNLKHSPSGL
jgi:SpoVK/Ycf46/Vps4 family AAA+-type ATPase